MEVGTSGRDISTLSAGMLIAVKNTTNPAGQMQMDFDLYKIALWLAGKENAGIAAGLVSAHVAQSNPHPQYAQVGDIPEFLSELTTSLGDSTNALAYVDAIKTRVAALETTLSTATDVDNVVNKLMEVLTAMNNFPEGVEVLTELNNRYTKAEADSRFIVTKGTGSTYYDQNLVLRQNEGEVTKVPVLKHASFTNSDPTSNTVSISWLTSNSLLDADLLMIQNRRGSGDVTLTANETDVFFSVTGSPNIILKTLETVILWRKSTGSAIIYNQFGPFAPSSTSISQFKGGFLSEALLTSAHPSGVLGDCAIVDAGTGSVAYWYIWDTNDSVWRNTGATGGTVPDATGSVPGKMKKYSVTGSNTDGTMDQDTITKELAKRPEKDDVKVSLTKVHSSQRQFQKRRLMPIKKGDVVISTGTSFSRNDTVAGDPGKTSWVGQAMGRAGATVHLIAQSGAGPVQVTKQLMTIDSRVTKDKLAYKVFLESGAFNLKLRRPLDARSNLCVQDSVRAQLASIFSETVYPASSGTIAKTGPWTANVITNEYPSKAAINSGTGMKVEAANSLLEFTITSGKNIAIFVPTNDQATTGVELEELDFLVNGTVVKTFNPNNRTVFDGTFVGGHMTHAWGMAAIFIGGYGTNTANITIQVKTKGNKLAIIDSFAVLMDTTVAPYVAINTTPKCHPDGYMYISGTSTPRPNGAASDAILDEGDEYQYSAASEFPGYPIVNWDVNKYFDLAQVDADKVHWTLYNHANAANALGEVLQPLITPSAAVNNVSAFNFSPGSAGKITILGSDTLNKQGFFYFPYNTADGLFQPFDQALWRMIVEATAPTGGNMFWQAWLCDTVPTSKAVPLVGVENTNYFEIFRFTSSAAINGQQLSRRWVFRETLSKQYATAPVSGGTNEYSVLAYAAQTWPFANNGYVVVTGQANNATQTMSVLGFSCEVFRGVNQAQILS